MVPSNHKTEIKFDFNDYDSDEHLFGTTRAAPYYHFTAYNNKYYWGRNGSEAYGGSFSTGIHTLVYNGDNNAVILDGTTLDSGSAIASTTNLLIGARGGSGGTNLKASVYYVKITDKSSGVIVRNLVPCYRKIDSTLGMYDVVNNVFYTRTGSGSFTKGLDIYY